VPSWSTEAVNPRPGRAGLGKIKGAAFAEFLSWYAAQKSTGAVVAALTAARALHRAELDVNRAGFGILASEWYDADFVHSVLDQVMKGHSPEELEKIARGAAEAVLAKTLRGIYRSVFALCVTPERYVRHIDKAWRLHYDNGYPAIIVPTPTEHRIVYRDWASHHPMACRLNMAAAYPIYEAMGCKNVRCTRIGCVSDGAGKCECVVTWG
jgi:hypothetical protein